MARTRGKGDGGMYRDANGYYTASIELKSADGTRRRKVVRAKTKVGLLEKLPRVRKELEGTGKKWTPSQTVEQYVTYWITDIAPKKVRPKTLATYRSIVKNHIIPVIGTTRLSALESEHIQRMHEAIAAKGLSSTTGTTAHWILSSALSKAVQEKRISQNPAEKVDAPLRAATKLEVLTVAEARAVVVAARPKKKEEKPDEEESHNPFPALWATFLLTGARRGEILGLQWDRVTDFLDLQWQLQRHPLGMTPPANYEHHHLTSGLFLTRPKSRAGTRSVPMFPALAHVLDLWRENTEPNPHNLVFAMPGGRPIDPDYATRLWVRHLKGVTEKAVRLHDLRHTAIDMLYDAGVPEHIITQVVGHSRFAMTRAYKSPTSRARVAEALMPFSDIFTPQSSETLELTE